MWLERDRHTYSSLKNGWTTVCRSSPVLRHLSRIGHSLFADADLHDHRLDLRPATFHRSWNRGHTASADGVGLFHRFQHGGPAPLCLFLCPSYLSMLVACGCVLARRRAAPGDTPRLP